MFCLQVGVVRPCDVLDAHIAFLMCISTAIANAKEQIRKSKNVPIQPLQLSYSSMEDEMECNVVGSPRSERRPVLEEFMPLKRRWEVQQRDDVESSDGERERSIEQAQQRPRGLQIEVGRPAWMAEAQLWTQNSSDQPADHQEPNNKVQQDLVLLPSILLLKPQPNLSPPLRFRAWVEISNLQFSGVRWLDFTSFPLKLWKLEIFSRA